jgi:hypothetical protein
MAVISGAELSESNPLRKTLYLRVLKAYRFNFYPEGLLVALNLACVRKLHVMD